MPLAITKLHTDFTTGVFIFFLVMTLLLSTELAAYDNPQTQQNEILVIGTGSILKGNVANARKVAINQALKKGVEEYLVRKLGDKGMMNNFPRIIHDVIPEAKEGIENFNILAEDRMEKNYKLLVRLRVNEKVMEEILKEAGLILTETPPIKLLFLVSQVMSQENMVSYWWQDPESETGLNPTELSLHREFQERGLRPISRLVNIPEGDYSDEMRALDLADEMVIRWGNLFSADVVIYGKCEIVSGGDVSVFLKAMDIRNENIIAQDSQIEFTGGERGGEEQILEGINRAVRGITTRMSFQIIKSFEAETAGLNTLKVILQGLKSYRQLKEFMDFLKKSVSGVDSVKQTRIKGNAVSLQVDFSGPEEEFLDRILKHEAFPFLADVGKTLENEIVFNIK